MVVGTGSTVKDLLTLVKEGDVGEGRQESVQSLSQEIL